MKSIKNKIIIFSILATLIPSIGLGILSFYQNEMMIKENLTRELRALTNYADHELNLWIKEQIYTVRELSHSKILTEGVVLASQSQKDKSARQKAFIEHYLKSVSDKLDTVLVLTAIDTNGQILASTIDFQDTIPIPRNWTEAASIQGNVIVPPHWNKLYATATLSILVPILSLDDYILGALVATFDLKNIHASLKDSIKSPLGEILILDRDNRIMLSSDDRFLHDSKNDAILFHDAEDLKQLEINPEVLQIPRGIGSEKVIGLAYVSANPPITIIAHRSYDSVYAAWKQQRDLFVSLVGAILAIVAIIAFKMGHAIVVPLQKLILATEDIVKGNFNVDLKTSQRNELGKLTQMFNQMADKLQRNQIEITSASNTMQEKNKLLETLSVTDSLTGLFNRSKLNSIINDQLARFSRNNRPFAILMIDIDYFKALNDSLGHIAGDEIIVSVAQKISHCIRSVDFAARYGGDEFVVILTETVAEEAIKTAERIRSHVANIQNNESNKLTKTVTLSIGIVQSENEDTSLTHLLSRVDSALYQAKHAGRNQTYCIRPKLLAANG
ncbi:diguanylate cyclase (GGDEF) domain-containing protein [Nitrosomonas sp. PY1]|nr:diguanylate cyclase (GGDEF) domain-containing protein [Nitrosomonas sp. PY1]